MEHYKCEDINAVLSGILDGEVDEQTRHMAEVHLAECADCRRKLEQAEQDDDLLRQAVGEREDWTEDLEHRIWAGILEPVATVRAFSRLRIAAWSGWLTAAAATIVVVFFLFNEFRSGLRDFGDMTPGGDGSFVIEGDVANGEYELMLAHHRELVGQIPVVTDDVVEPQEVETTDDATTDTTQQEASPTFDPKIVVTTWNAARGASGRMAEGIDGVRNTASTFIEQLANAAETETQQDTELAEVLTGDGVDNGMIETATEPEDDYFVASTAGDDLYHAAVLLDVLAQADVESFNDVRLIGEAIEQDDLLDRLAESRRVLDDDDEVRLVNQAWTALEWVNGRMDQDDLRRVQGLIDRNHLSERVEELSQRVH